MSLPQLANPKALLVDGVSHSFGTRKALDNVSFSVESGMICGLLGLNGAGKTTLFSLITRLYDNTSGAIQVLGHDGRRRPMQALRHLGVVFQSRTLDPDLSIEQNMFYHAALYGLSGPAARERMQLELERSNLAARRHEKVRNLSGGQLRRVEIARALLHRPNLLLLDEPTVGLDIGARQDIIAHVRKLVESDRLAVLWATHLFDEITPTDKAVILHVGKVLADGDYHSVLKQANAIDLPSAFRNFTGAAPIKDAV